ncbi:MAG: hypothetical protein ACM3ML_14415 [Micromonosporaceae bacterium]
MPKTRKRRWRIAAIAAASALVLGIGGLVFSRHAKPFLIGEGCRVRVFGQAIELDAEQAAVAATIAGVSYRRGMPKAAVTVAYATALQESKMHNVRYGDRDSVGIFQQRPSEGWGTRRDLMDPVYATSKFFAALGKVPGYMNMPVYRAAQAVQHSADGTAYGQYEQVAGLMSTAFTGHAARAVWCWYMPYTKRPAKLASAGDQLKRTFGHLAEAGSAFQPSGELAGADDGTGGIAMTVHVPATETGWAIATWSVAHAKIYGIRRIRYAGYQWRATDGEHGWRRDAGAPSGRVEVG